MLDVELKIKLVVQAPFSTQSSTLDSSGIHAPLAKTQGIPYIPGTLLKGRLRQSWRELRRAAGELFLVDEKQLLGEQTGSPGANSSVTVEPRRGLLRFS